MRKLILVLVSASIGSITTAFVLGPRASAVGGHGGGVEKCSVLNGDVNADGAVDISDAVTILGNLFLGAPSELAPLCNSAQGLPDTGQTQCFDCEGRRIACVSCVGQPRGCDGFTDRNLTLQDALQGTGCPNDENRFTDNGDGTVTDNCTGLMWQNDTADQPGDDAIQWCSALRYCNELQFAGHDDWRLPNARELQSLIDYGRGDPMIDPVFGAVLSAYWTSTSDAASPGNAWTIAFRENENFFFRVGKESFLYVRAVRTAR
jgi:hypothetical protein